MSVFLIIAGLLVAVALLFLIPPLLRVQRSSDAAHPERDSANAGLYRDQLAELDTELAAGNLSEDQHRNAKLEIERRLLDDVGKPGDTLPAPARPPRWVPLAVGAILPVIAASFYLWVGNPAALDPRARVAPDAAESITPAQIAGLVDQLAERLKKTPRDLEGWVMLARSYNLLGRFEESAQAYAQVMKLAPDDPSVLADYAEVLGMARGRKLQGEPYALVKRALKLDPGHLKALALAGSAEYEAGNYREAAAYWERIVPSVGADSELGRSLQASIDDARNQAKVPARGDAQAPPSAVTGTVKLAPALASQVAAGDTLFVFARAPEGSRMPLAVLRAKAGDLPYVFRLDDSQAMTPNARLSDQPRIVVGARISKSGNAMPQPGDLQGISPPVAPGASGLVVVIDQKQK